MAKHGYAADRTEARLGLIASHETEINRRCTYRQAALFPNIVEATRLFASRF
ncbi:hypothetical protein AB0C96_35305 [Streptomyces sp. NPDC048506]|uniref:hypothetical protein n=1 Tax=Streptomyces sp. NPDC048506 TaxID=3155028 RepID=UPI00341A2DD0